MNAKLTLSIEQTIVEKAKIYAKSKGDSLPGIVENYLKVITKEDENSDNKLTPVVKSLKGAFKAPSDFDYKKELERGLSEKYL